MRSILFSIILLSAIRVVAQGYPTVTEPTFKRGELLTYRVHYGIIDAGEATIEVASDAPAFAGKSTYHLVGRGKSTGTFDWFFKVRDRYDSYVDEETLLPRFFMRRVDEGGFIINQDYLFNQSKSMVSVKRDGTDKPRNVSDKSFEIPANTHDILSAFYYARTIDFSSLKPGDVVTVNTFFDEEIFPLSMKVVGREVLKTKAGKIHCIKIRPGIQKGRVFKEEEDLTLWVSDDKNRIPVRLQANVLVGSIKMDLKEYKNLANQLAVVK